MLTNSINVSKDLRMLVLGLILTIGLTFTLLINANRNIYDDELTSAARIVTPMSQIIRVANSGDVHPPGMYLLSRIGYLLTRSIRWTTVFPLLVWLVGLASFLYYSSQLFQSTSLYALFAVICIFHPHVLMWTNSIRWYPYWSGIALVTISLLILRDNSTNSSYLLSWEHVAILGVGLAILFYISYLTVILGFWLVISLLVYYRLNKRNLLLISSALLLSGLLSIPQLNPLFKVHLQNSASQTFGLYKSTFKLLYGLSIGEAVLPWHPLSIGVTCVVTLPCVIGLIWYSKHNLISWNKKRDYKITSFGVFLIGMILTGAISGLGWKPRSFLVLIPIVVLLLTLGGREIKHKVWHVVAIVMVVLLLVQGGYNIYMKDGTAKGGINDPLEKVVNAIYERTDTDKAIIFTHHPALAWYLNKFRDKRRLEWEIISLYGRLDSLPPGTPPHVSEPEKIVFVESFIGSLKEVEKKLRLIQKKVVTNMSNIQTLKIGKTVGEKWKEKLAGIDLPTYRFTIYIGNYAKPRSKLKPLIIQFKSL